MIGKLLFFGCISFCSAYFINIDAHGEECFHDRVNPGTKMALRFEVADGGFLDIDVKVKMNFININMMFIHLTQFIVPKYYIFRTTNIT